MKNLGVIVLIFIAFNMLGQNKGVTLNWKIDKKEQLNYATVMSEIDTALTEMNFHSFFESFSDSTSKKTNELGDFFKKLNREMQKLDYITTLTNKGKGVIDIAMSVMPNEEKEKTRTDTINKKETEMVKMIQAMNQGGVMLRGSVYANGGIHSFWVKSSQKNMIAAFFELPKKHVKIGETWTIDIDLISNDQNFTCDSAYKINEVKLVDIKKVNGETIAVVKYNIVEYVNGTFNAPSFLGGEKAGKATMMKFTHYALAEFSVDKGRWVFYDGIMSLEATGAMTAKKKTKFTLIPQ